MKLHNERIKITNYVFIFFLFSFTITNMKIIFFFFKGVKGERGLSSRVSQLILSYLKSVLPKQLKVFKTFRIGEGSKMSKIKMMTLQTSKQTSRIFLNCFPTMNNNIYYSFLTIKLLD